MIDREKVIKGLETCYCPPAKCEDCPYNDIEKNCNDALCLDALALLKEQEAQCDYEASIEMAEYCERYEQTYNPEDGNM